jgi:hypothetical protein
MDWIVDKENFFVYCTSRGNVNDIYVAQKKLVLKLILPAVTGLGSSAKC